MNLPKRNEVPEQLTWDLTRLYASDEAMLSEVARMTRLSEETEAEFKGQLTTPERINACLDKVREIMGIMIRTSTYTELLVNADFTNAESARLGDRVNSAIARMFSRIAFVDGEIMEQDEEVLQKAMETTTANRGKLADLLREKPHHLGSETERVLAALSQTMETPYSVYNMTKLADMQFDPFTVNGETFPLGYSLFEDDYEYDSRPEVRRAAFDAFSAKLRQYVQTTATAYNAQVQKEKTLADLRGFASVTDYLLFDQKVTREMYERQIDVIMEELAPHMRRYAKLLQKAHDLEKMTYADLKVPVDPQYDPKITIPEAEKLIADGLAIMGEDYRAMVHEAIEQRWVDFARNQGKCTGGFCTTPYGAGSYILMTWNDRMSDALTLAHELGHAGHFSRCNEAQSVFDTEVSTYMVEAPSTINELLVEQHLLRTSKDKRLRRWVISCMVGDTYYHNCVTHLLEAAYQREVYRIVDAGGSVQAETLCDIYRGVLEKFWGDAVELTPGCELTWMRQPHYYMGLYPYTYSAGLTVATQAALHIAKEGQRAVEDWKRMLLAGGTKTPLELAAMAGVDISSDKALRDTVAYIGSLVDELWALTDELEEN